VTVTFVFVRTCGIHMACVLWITLMLTACTFHDVPISTTLGIGTRHAEQSFVSARFICPSRPYCFVLVFKNKTDIDHSERIGHPLGVSCHIVVRAAKSGTAVISRQVESKYMEFTNWYSPNISIAVYVSDTTLEESLTPGGQYDVLMEYGGIPDGLGSPTLILRSFEFKL